MIVVRGILMRNKLSLALFLSTSALSSAANVEDGNLRNSLIVDGFVKLDLLKVYFNDTAFDNDFIKRAMEVRNGRVSFASSYDNWTISFGAQKNYGLSGLASDVDCVITYRGLSKSNISFGKMYPIYGLEWSQSKLHGTFMEDSIAGQMFAMERRAAVTMSGNIGSFGGGASIFLTGENYLNTYNNAWKYGLSARGFYNNVEPNKVWSVGLSFYYEDATRSTTTRTFQLIGTGVGFSNISQKANNYASLGGVFVAGDKSAQAEIFYNIAYTDVNKLYGSVQGAWVVTGEVREFDASTGTLGSVVASNSANGAVELALRADYLYISGAAKNEYAFTFGTNWYLNSNVKMQANLVVASIDNDAITGTDDDDKYVIGAGLRAQVSF